MFLTGMWRQRSVIHTPGVFIASGCDVRGTRVESPPDVQDLAAPEVRL
jgi:hypothetical protein